MADFTYNPDQAEADSWAARRRRATSDYGLGSAQLTAQRSQTQANQTSDFGRLSYQWDQMRRRLPGNFIRRGVQNSGIAAQGYQDYATQRNQAFGDLSRRYSDMLTNQGLQQQGLEQNYTNTMADIDEQERIRRAQLAAQIRGAF